MKLFNEFGLSNKLLGAIKKDGITTPTLIQEKSIPLIMKGKDVVGESATGSGKTLAFGCGIIDNVDHGKGLQALVLTPTRELAEQVKDALKKFSSNLNVIAVYGGVAINPQIHALSKADVLVATPGRFLDHLQRNTVETSKVKILVLDEADRMLDMGFIDDVEKIIKNCPKKRQTLFFSATIMPSIKRLINKYMVNPVKVSATRMVDPSKLKQVYYDIKKNIKLSLLVHLLRNEKSGLVMVFCNTRRNVDFIAKNLKSNKIDATAIHGGLSQYKRSKTLTSFNKGKAVVLVCTDVAARGLHIEDVSHVYNYDIPSDPTDYVHRIGRTARAGKSGKVVNLISDLDHSNFSRVFNEHRNYNIKKLETPKVERVFAAKDERRDRGGQRSQGGKSWGLRPKSGPGRRSKFYRGRR